MVVDDRCRFERRRVVVIGAGAAGTMAAIFAAASGADTLLLERTARRRAQDPHQWRRALQHPAGQARRIALRQRCPAASRPPDRAFVAAQGTNRVLRARARPAARRRSGVGQTLPRVATRTGRARSAVRPRATARRPAADEHGRDRVQPDTGGWRIDVQRCRPLHADALVVATGGLSVPSTGSDGGGLRIAEAGPHDPADLRRADAAHRQPGAIRVAVGRLAAGHAHSARGGSLVDGNRRLPLHAPRLQRAGGPRRVSRGRAISRGGRCPRRLDRALDGAWRRGVDES